MTKKYLRGERIQLLGPLSLWQCFDDSDGIDRYKPDEKHEDLDLVTL